MDEIVGALIVGAAILAVAALWRVLLQNRKGP